MAKGVIWVYPSGGVWVVKKGRTSKASAIRNTKKEAYQVARNIALNQNLTIKIRDGNSLKTISPKEARDNNCFITTACVKYYGMEDNCYELQTLRKYRDNYLLKSQGNKKLVKKYYSIAPGLVKQLEDSPNREQLYKKIFSQIKIACNAIENNQFEKAKLIYTQAVSRLFYQLK